MDLEIDVKIDKQTGADLVIPLEIDYGEWLRSIDLRTDTPQEINQKIREGIQSSISLFN